MTTVMTTANNIHPAETCPARTGGRSAGRWPRPPRLDSGRRGLIIIAALAALSALAGCGSSRSRPMDPGPSPIAGTPGRIEATQVELRGLADADADETDTIRRQAAGLDGEPARTIGEAAGRMFDRIGQRLRLIAGLSETRADVEAALGREVKIAEYNRAMAARAESAESELAALEARWYVRWGRWLTRAFWFVVLGWGAMGLFAAVFGLGNPLSWVGRVANFVGDTIPLTWVFRVLRAPVMWIRGMGSG